MSSGLYYPHSAIENDSILLTALLLWDDVEFIVPQPGFHRSAGNSTRDRTVELIGKSITPSDDEKQRAHVRILALAESDLPPEFKFDPANPNLGYQIFPSKFLPQTWDAVQKSRLAAPYTSVEFQDYILNPWFGLVMMAILAEECAGTRRRVTDEIDGYKALERLLIQESGGRVGSRDDASERLVNIALATINPDGLKLEQVLAVREQEQTLSRVLREHFMSEVDKAVAQITADDTAIREADRIVDDFRRRMETDFKELKRALRLNAAASIFTKSVIVGGTIAAGLALEPTSSALVLAGTLGGDIARVNAARRKILKDHAASWLYGFTGAARVI